MDTRGCWPGGSDCGGRLFCVAPAASGSSRSVPAECNVRVLEGVTPRAIVKLVAGVFCALNALVVPAPRFLCCCAWFVGFFLSAGAYILPMNKVQNIGSITRLESQGLATDRWACLVSRLAICCHLKISPDHTEKTSDELFFAFSGHPIRGSSVYLNFWNTQAGETRAVLVRKNVKYSLTRILQWLD